VFVGCTEKTGLPGFGCSGQGDNPALRGEDGSRCKTCNSQDLQDGGLVYTQWDL
jgi:hypothetical protein